MVATMAFSYTKRQDSAETTEDGRPLESIQHVEPSRWFSKIRRTPVRKSNGDGYTKKNNNEIIEGPWKMQMRLHNN